YPDLPKNFQISQYDMPFSEGGKVEFILNGERKTIRLIRVHLEEDAGKLIHDEAQDVSYVDLNRTGTPLLEIVSEPDMTSPEEAYEFLNSLKLTLRYLDVSDCNMQEGSLRCDANINIRVGDDVTPISEVKNLNSFRGVESAMKYEAERQFKEYRKTGCTKLDTPKVTVGWNAEKEITVIQRTKEEAHDYRYFPEPDIPPLELSKDFINEIRDTLCELPIQRKERLINDMGLTEYDADVLVQDIYLADYFEQTYGLSDRDSVKECANLITNDVLRAVKERDLSIREFPVSPASLAELILSIKKGEINNSIARDKVFPEMVETGKSAQEIIKEKNLVQISDENELSDIVIKVLDENPKGVEDYLGGKKQAIGFLMGKVMQSTKGKADHKVVVCLLEKHIKELKEI
ncbi:Asp-tRNA(Asn)/Glu-tRNA(Gln) amidotransferase subunit GatB, partial [Planctomycetota bacterium]